MNEMSITNTNLEVNNQSFMEQSSVEQPRKLNAY